jgi:hypothetical protein
LIRLVLLLQLASTLYMVGVIWMVQLSHYPLMALVGPDHMAAWQAENLQRTTWVVGLPMLVEAVTVGALVVMDEGNQLGALPWMGGLFLLGIWGSTALLQVPAHDALAQGLNVETVQRLVSTNWIRTVLWSARGALVLYMVHRSWGGA